MANTTISNRPEVNASFKRNFRNEREALANRVDKSKTIKDYESKIKKLEADLETEVKENGEETKRAWTFMRIINDLKTSLKLEKDLSFLGIFLQLGMIGLILVGVISIFWPLGSGFATIVSLIGVLIFALFTAYDMQFLKRAYSQMGDDTQKNQLAVLGALHLYVAFITMFQYILSLLNLGRR